MHPLAELIMEDPDFVLAHAEEGFFHFNIALADCARSPSEAVRAAEHIAGNDSITKAAAALMVAKEIEYITSHETGEWQLH